MDEGYGQVKTLEQVPLEMWSFFQTRTKKASSARD